MDKKPTRLGTAAAGRVAAGGAVCMAADMPAADTIVVDRSVIAAVASVEVLMVAWTVVARRLGPGPAAPVAISYPAVVEGLDDLVVAPATMAVV